MGPPAFSIPGWPGHVWRWVPNPLWPGKGNNTHLDQYGAPLKHEEAHGLSIAPPNAMTRDGVGMGIVESKTKGFIDWDLVGKSLLTSTLIVGGVVILILTAPVTVPATATIIMMNPQVVQEVINKAVA